MSRSPAALLLLALWVAGLGAASAVAARHLSITSDLRLFLPSPATSEQRLLLEGLGEGPAARVLAIALSGAPRPMPDTLQINVDLSAKFMIFRVGVSRLVGNFAFVRSNDERGWAMHFRREPDWHFPLAVNHLISTSLRHPFEGEGITVRISVRDRPGSQTLLSREASVAVQESAIVRWLGGLGNSAMSDFAGRAEAEENRYVFDVLSALRSDFVAGHEFAGVVTAIGAGVEGIAVGDNVVADSRFWCGDCDRCRNGHRHRPVHRANGYVRADI